MDTASASPTSVRDASRISQRATSSGTASPLLRHRQLMSSGTAQQAGQLSEEKWSLDEAPSGAARRCRAVDFPWDVRPIVESHHECWDRSGYPHGSPASGFRSLRTCVSPMSMTC
jgi:hypothetical protein